MNENKWYHAMSDEELTIELAAAINKVAMIENIVAQRQKEKRQRAWVVMMNAINKYVEEFGPIYVQTDYAGTQELQINECMKEPNYFKCSDC